MRFRLGVVAMATSFVPYLALGVVPFLGVSLAGIAGLIAVSLIGAEVIFWSGLVLAGADARAAIRQHGWARTPRILWDLLVAGQARETRSA